jgi:hypothetical protein
MNTPSAAVEPIVLDEADTPLDGWDDPVRGRIHWRTLFSQGLTRSAGITCGVAELGPGDWLGLHRHAPPETYYVIAGAGIVSLDGREIPVKAGSAVFIPGMAEHGIRHTGLRFCGSSTPFRSIRSTASSICSLVRPTTRTKRAAEDPRGSGAGRLPAPARRDSGADQTPAANGRNACL